jgi:ubiquinone/menaquinone biosynthesis C-methylase UbiE
MNERELFYYNSVLELIVDKKVSILVCGGGDVDKKVFEKLGFRNVTISNLDSRMSENSYQPYIWKYENAESLSFPDESFDYVVIHAAIHHASSPHKVLTECYRTAKLGVLAIESRDSAIMRCFERTGLTDTYEVNAVYSNDCKYGGVNNTEIPNFIYRWTEREIEKCIKSYAPFCIHKFLYRYANAFPSTIELENRSMLKHYLLKLGMLFYQILAKIFPKQQNLFAFYIKKPKVPDDLFSWIIYDENERVIRFNKEWRH